MKKKVAVFGGAFDPPHIGHKKVIKYLLENILVDEVLVMPCGLHKIKGEIKTATEHRMRMAQLAFEKMSGVKVSSVDIDLSNRDNLTDDPGNGSTLNLLKTLYREYKEKNIEAELFFVIGQDNADTIKSWYNWEELINNWRFIVLPRENDTSSFKWYENPLHIYLKDFELVNISSTEIRNKLNSDFIEESVYKYITKNKLY